jgi:glycosyltransferase involved in cell wall biosynthesis
MLRNADRTFYVNPDLRRWLPGAEFRPYASVDPLAIDPPPLPPDDEVVVVHAPSHRGIKGTEHVIAAVESLQADGLPVRLDLVEGVSHEEARARYAGAHLAVDQLNIGWYGVFAVEMMALGRPVVCRIVEDEPGDNPFGADLPIVRSSPETLREDLRALCSDAGRRQELGAASRRFVEASHDPRVVARRALEGVVPLPSPAL